MNFESIEENRNDTWQSAQGEGEDDGTQVNAVEQQAVVMKRVRVNNENVVVGKENKITPNTMD